jgi:hypothetical protein
VEGFTSFFFIDAITCSKSCRVALRLLIKVPVFSSAKTSYGFAIR